MPVKMFLFTRIGILIVSAITEQTEIRQRDTRDIQEHLIRNYDVERFKCCPVITISHQERWNRPGESAKVILDGIHHRALLFLPFFRLHISYSSIAGFLHHCINGLSHLFLEVFSGFFLLIIKFPIDFSSLSFGSSTLKLSLTIRFKRALLRLIISERTVKYVISMIVYLILKFLFGT